MATVRVLVTLISAAVFVSFSTWELLNRVVVAIAAVIVVAFLWSRWSLKGIGLIWSLPQDRAQVGQLLASRFSVSNSGRLPKPWLEVRDESNFPGHTASRVVRVGRRDSVSWEIQTLCRRRGRHQIGPMSLLSADPFGAFPAIRRVPGVVDVTIYPAEFELPHFPIPSGLLTGSAATQRRTPFVTPSVAGIREYAPGDGFNQISWSATARLGRFMVKEFDIDPTSDVWVLVDCDRAYRVETRTDSVASMPKPFADDRLRYLDSTEEYAVAAAASVAKHCLDQQRGVGLIVSAAHHEIIPAERSERTRVKILETLAVASADGQRPLADVLMGEWRRFGRHSGVVIVTSSTDPNWVDVVSKMHAQRIHVAAIVIDGGSFGTAPPVAPVVDQLARAGVPAYVLRNGSDIGLTLSSLAA